MRDLALLVTTFGPLRWRDGDPGQSRHKGRRRQPGNSVSDTGGAHRRYPLGDLDQYPTATNNSCLDLGLARVFRTRNERVMAMLLSCSEGRRCVQGGPHRQAKRRRRDGIGGAIARRNGNREALDRWSSHLGRVIAHRMEVVDRLAGWSRPTKPTALLTHDGLLIRDSESFRPRFRGSMPTSMVGPGPRRASLETESAEHPSRIGVNPCQKGKKRKTPRGLGSRRWA